MMNSRVTFGIDAVLKEPGLLAGKAGLLTNNAARPALDPECPGRKALLQSGVKITRLFSPEHGMEAQAPDGVAVRDGMDIPTGLPVVSLYGEHLRPPPETLEGLDLMVFDVPDIGARFYTYIWTLRHLLEACAEKGLPLTVLDRPNPLGGDPAAAEGPMLDTARFSSFLGRDRIPIRHGLTAGELALLWNAEAAKKADLKVIPCPGWMRHQHWPDTGLPFIPTSPAMPDYFSALLYPGTCLFEATNLSAGRGTAFPFRTVGAPWLDAPAVCQEFNRRSPPGLLAEPVRFAPTQPPWERRQCQGVHLRVTRAQEVRPVAAGLLLLSLILRQHRADFEWERYPTAANPSGEGHFELLAGQADIREALEEHPETAPARIPQWTTAPGWAERTAPFLLYPFRNGG